MNKKEFYASPEAETFEVRFEGGILTGSNINAQNHSEYFKGGLDDGYEEL